MKLSTQNKLFISAVFLVWLLLCYLLVDAFVANDSNAVLNEAIRGVYINWKPPIHSWLLLQFYELTGSNIGAFQCHYFAQLFLLGGGICLISYYLSQFRRIYILSSLILFLLTPWTARVHIVGNDALFIGSLLFAIGFFLNSYRVKPGWVRYTGIVVSYVLLFFAMVCRINSAPALFALIFALSYANRCTIKQALSISCLFIIGILALQSLIHHTFLRAEKGYPLNFLYISDMQNTSILNGEWVEFYKKAAESQQSVVLFPPRDIPFVTDNVNFFKTPIDFYIKRTDESFSNYVRAGWVDTLQDHPKEVLICRFYAYQQFLLGGRSLWFINDWIKQSYPGAVILHDENHRKWENYLSGTFVMFSLLNFIILVVLMLYLLMFLKKKRGVFKDEGIQMGISLAVCGWFYLLSFLPLTLSSTEVRYYLPHSVCFAFSLALFSLYTCDRLLGSQRKKSSAALDKQA